MITQAGLSKHWQQANPMSGCGPGTQAGRFGDVRFPAGRAEPVSRDGVCLTTVGQFRQELTKREESAVEPAQRSPVLTSTHEARPCAGTTSSKTIGIENPTK